MTKPKKKKKLRLVTDLREKLQYYKKTPRRKDGTIPNIRDMCPYCSDKKKEKRVYPYWLKRDRGPGHKPRWAKENKKCPKCKRVFSEELREVVTF